MSLLKIEPPCKMKRRFDSVEFRRRTEIALQALNRPADSHRRFDLVDRPRCATDGCFCVAMDAADLGGEKMTTRRKKSADSTCCRCCQDGSSHGRRCQQVCWACLREVFAPHECEYGEFLVATLCAGSSSRLSIKTCLGGQKAVIDAF